MESNLTKTETKTIDTLTEIPPTGDLDIARMDAQPDAVQVERVTLNTEAQVTSEIREEENESFE